MPPPSEPTSPLPPRWAASDRYVPRRFVQPVLTFMRWEAGGGIVMLAAAVVALVWANSPLQDTYGDLFGATVEVAFGGLRLEHLSELTVRGWINDGLMAIFFFVVGLEIKRELVVGELRDPRAAALPAIAALGGMAVPALLFTLVNGGGPGSNGWGIPMATDIAFAVGVVSMIGTRVPIGAKLFLLALAIVDDLGAILVIAVFYTGDLSFAWLALAGGGLVVAWVMGRVGIRSLLVYMGLGGVVWLGLLESGVHATLAGVALALLTPVRTLYDPSRFAARAGDLVARIDAHLPEGDELAAVEHRTLERVQSLLGDLRHLAQETISPLDRLEQVLLPWTSYVVVPLFALANAGVAIGFGDLGTLLTEPVTLGVGLGLLVGKVVGVTGAAWLAVRLGLGRLPARTTWAHMVGVGFLAGIGFTVALFVAALSYPDATVLADQAKVGIFVASLLAGLAGFVWLRLVAPPADVAEPVPGRASAREDIPTR